MKLARSPTAKTFSRLVAQVLVDDDGTAVELDARVGEVCGGGLDADADDRQLRLDPPAFMRRRVRESVAPPCSSATASPSTISTPRSRYSCSSVVDNSGCASAAKSRSPGSTTGHLEAEAPQRGGGLHPDEACADDQRPVCRGGVLSHRERVVEGAVGRDAVELLAGDVEPSRGRPVASTSRS